MTGRGEDSGSEGRSTARAFVPGHVTGFFSVHRREDPAATGSRGAGITLVNGVEVAVEDHDAVDPSVRFNGSPATIEPVDRVLDRLDVSARVTIETSLPIGAGFGVSGAAALGTAFAASEHTPDPKSVNELITIAHAAEVEAGTGLGDVVAQARGGVPIRLEPGAPPHGDLDGIAARSRIEYVTFGELSTDSVLAGETAALTAAGERALETFVDRPTLGAFFHCSNTFAEAAGLLDPTVAEAIEAVTDIGGAAAMAMLGRTVIARGYGLSDAGYDPVVTAIDPCGARLETTGLSSARPSRSV